MMQVRKLDKRYSGYPYFKYFVELSQSNEINFHNVRAWCWNTWGASKGFKDWEWHHLHPHIQYDVCQNSNWCWVDDQFRNRILFKEREDVALFKLYHGA